MQKQSMSSILQQKGARDLFLDFLSVLFETELDTVDVFCEMFERMHNTLTCSMDTTHLHAKQEAVIMRFFIF